VTDPQSTAVTVLVADDHPLWRDAVTRDLEQAGYRVVATAATGAEAVRRAAATRPDVVLTDLNMPDGDGVACTTAILAANPNCRVLVLSASGEADDVLAAVKAGATGYLVKSASREDLLEAVARTARGDAVFTPGLETEVLRLVAKGLSYKDIAARLVLSHRTVQNHVQNTLGKLHLHNRVELVRYAIATGLEDPREDVE
jgi:DNA-binding NarL/FixJ family response regulator